MKKVLFSLFTAAFSFTALSAQSYTVYMVGSPGYQYQMAIDETLDPTDLPLDLSVVGTGLVWNFQNLDMDSQDTLYFHAPTTQEQLDFPSANLVMESNIGRIVFEKDPTNGLYLHGTSINFGGFDLSLNYTPAQRTLLATNVLGTMDSSISKIDESIFVDIDTMVLGFCHIDIDSIKIKRTSKYNVHFDAAGELRLPTDTFTNTLRAVNSEHTIDSIFIYCPNGIDGMTCFGISAPVGWSLAPDALIALSGFGDAAVMQDTTNAATWYVAGASSPILAVDFEYDYPGFTDTSFFTARYAAVENAAIGFENYNPIDLKVYPNPTSSLLLLQTDVNLNNAVMTIYNAQGQVVRTANLNGNNSMDVSNLNTGIYIYRITDGNKLLHQGKFGVNN